MAGAPHVCFACAVMGATRAELEDAIRAICIEAVAVPHLLTFSWVQVGLIEDPSLLQDCPLLDPIERRVLDCTGLTGVTKRLGKRRE